MEFGIVLEFTAGSTSLQGTTSLDVTPVTAGTLRLARSVTFPVNWKPSDDTDYSIRRWMSHRGWGVSRTEYHPAHKVYCWHYEPGGGTAIVLRITRGVLEDYPAFALWELLDRLHVAAELRAKPEAYLVVMQRGKRVFLEAWEPNGD